MKNQTNHWDWVDTAEAMEMLHCSRNTLHNLAKRGILKKSKLGKRCYYSRTQIDDTLRRNIICEDGSLDTTFSQRPTESMA